MHIHGFIIGKVLSIPGLGAGAGAKGAGFHLNISNLISNPMVMVHPFICCTAAPRIPRPSDEQFIKHALNVAESLLHYPGSGKYLVLL